MEQWQNAKLDDTRNPRATPDVWFPLNDPKEGGRGGITISLARDTGVSPRPRPERTDLPPEELPARLKAGLSLPPGEYTLADLAERLSASKVVVRFPSYAANRKVVAFSHDGKLGEILSGLCVLYGWTATPTRSGYQVGLPRFDPAKDAQDLHLKLQRMVPPAVRYQVRILSQGEYGRSGHQWAAIIQEAEHLGGKEWKSLPLSRFSTLGRARMANDVASHQIHYWTTAMGNRDTPPAWIHHPELGVLRLSGPVGPGLHPSIRFEVPAPNGRPAGWSYAVGTAMRVRPGQPPVPIE